MVFRRGHSGVKIVLLWKSQAPNRNTEGLGSIHAMKSWDLATASGSALLKSAHLRETSNIFTTGTGSLAHVIWISPLAEVCFYIFNFYVFIFSFSVFSNVAYITYTQ